jgi:hypothetical protein
MMRVDPQDRSDIQFLLNRGGIHELRLYLDRACVPDLPEIQEAFRQNRRWLLDQVQSFGS